MHLTSKRHYNYLAYWLNKTSSVCCNCSLPFEAIFIISWTWFLKWARSNLIAQWKQVISIIISKYTFSCRKDWNFIVKGCTIQSTCNTYLGSFSDTIYYFLNFQQLSLSIATACTEKFEFIYSDKLGHMSYVLSNSGTSQR